MAASLTSGSRSIGLSVLIAIVVVCTVATLVLDVISFSKNPYNEERIAPTFALASGISPYQVGAYGPLLSVLYGPLFYILYLPVALARDAASSLTVGTVVSLVFFLLPVLYVSAVDRKASFLVRTIPPLMFVVLALSTYWGEHVMLAIHPDASACGLAGLALVIVAAGPGTISIRRLVIAALLSTGAVFCKQNAIIVIPALWSLVLYRHGYRWFQRAVLVTILAAIGLIGLFAFIYGGVSGIWFNNYTIPRMVRLEWSRAPAALRSLYQSALFGLLFLGILMTEELTSGTAGTLTDKGRRFLPLSLILVCGSLPLCFAGYCYPGGAGNNFAPAFYCIFLLGFWWIRRILKDSVATSRAALGAVVFAFLVAISSLSLAISAPQLRSTFRKHPSLVAQEFYAKHSGDVYLPFNPVAVYYAKKCFYHTDWGTENRAVGGFPVSDEELTAHMPTTAKFLAYPVPAGFGPHYLATGYLANRLNGGFPAQEISLPGLEDFSAYAIRTVPDSFHTNAR